MAYRYEDVDQAARDRIEKGVVALRRINEHEGFNHWMAVGDACAEMQRAAMRLAGSNINKGKGYNAAFNVIADANPDLSPHHLDKTTRSHAVWIADPVRRADIEAWHERLPGNIRQQVNHPTVVYRRYNRDTAVPNKPGEETAAPTLTLSQKKDAELIRLQEERDALAAKLERFGRDADNAPLLHRNSATNEAIAVLREFFSATKGAAIAAGWMASYKADKAAPRAKEPKPAARDDDDERFRRRFWQLRQRRPELRPKGFARELNCTVPLAERLYSAAVGGWGEQRFIAGDWQHIDDDDDEG